MNAHPGVIRHWGEYLPLTAKTPIISLGEGDTPLVRSSRLEKAVGCAELYFKLESCQPTGSFKDRGMVMAVAKAMEEGNNSLVCASTGNTSASAAAYGAHCELRVNVLVPNGKIAQGKLAQAVAYGARIIAVDGNFDKALTLAQEITKREAVALVNSVNPYRIEGQKTAAFEIIDVIGDAPDYQFMPVGNAGNITAYWKGYREFVDLGRSTHRPIMMGVQAAGAAPIVLGHPVEKPDTIATAIRIGNPASWKQAEAARDESGGKIFSCTDEEIVAAYSRLASEEGVFGEPASAASVAGLLKMVEQGLDLSGKRVVCIITGSGLKDPDTAMKLPMKIHEVAAEYAAVREALAI